MSSRSNCGWARPVAASLLCLIAAARWGGYLVDEGLALLLVPGLAMFAAAGLVHVRAPGAQMMARAAMWSVLLLAGLMAQLGSSRELAVAVVVALGCGGGLLVLGQRGLDAPSSRFQPVAYRGTIFAALTLAMADTLSLSFWSLVALDDANAPATGAALAGCAVAMVVGVVGLYRLKTWGLVVNVSANLGIAGLVGFGAIDTPPFVSALLVTTALVQLVVPAPLVVGILRGRRPEAHKGRPGVSRLVAPAAVLAVVALALQPLVSQPLLERLF